MNSFRAENFRLEAWLPAGFTVADFIALMAGLAVVAAFLAVWNALRTNTAFERRLAVVAHRKESLRQSALSPRRQRQQLTPAGLMHEAVKRLNLLRSKHATEARLLLLQAGMRSRDAVVRYLFARVTLPLVLAVAALADAYTLHLLPIPAHFRFLSALGGALIGYIAPNTYLKNITSRRVQRMQKGLPDALDLMVICAEAGLSLDATLLRVSRELENTWPDLAEEFGITAAELTFLPERRQAFDNLNARTNMASIRGVVNTLLQTAKFGTPLAHSLRVLAGEFRDARMIRAEEKAARLPALLTVPLILFILPTLFIVLLGPAALNIIDTFSGNHHPRSHEHITVIRHSGGGDDQGEAAPDVTEIQANDQNSGTSTGTQAVSSASVVPETAEVAAGQPVVIDVDATALASGSNWQIAIVPAGAPDAPPDFASLGTAAAAVAAQQMQVTLTPKTPGQDEVRLYYLPQSRSTPVVAARASIEVKPAAK